ncbi:hypothetical protein F5880DRAFT_1746242, partial [Lentinula raphanica]
MDSKLLGLQENITVIVFSQTALWMNYLLLKLPRPFRRYFYSTTEHNILGITIILNLLGFSD